MGFSFENRIVLNLGVGAMLQRCKSLGACAVGPSQAFTTVGQARGCERKAAIIMMNRNRYPELWQPVALPTRDRPTVLTLA